MDDLILSKNLKKVARIGTWKVFLETEKVWWSPMTYEIHEEDPNKVITLQDGVQYYLEEDRKVIEKSIQDSVKNKTSWDVELRIRTATGKVRWVRALGEAVIVDGEAIQLQGVFQDIDKQKRTALALETANSKINLALERSGIGFFEWDVVNNILTWDPSMYRLYGVAQEDFSSAYDAWLSGLVSEDQARGDKEVQQALAGEKEFDSEFRIRWPDQSIRHIKGHAIVVRDTEGKPLKMLGTNWDITEQKVREDQIQFLNFELQTVFDAIPGLVMHKSKDDILVRVNKYAAETMNTTTEAMNGRPSTDFYPPEVCEKYHLDDLEVINSGEAKLGIIEEYYNARGHRRWLKTDKVPYTDKDGKNTGIVLCAFDVTKQTQDQRQLERLNEELTQFTYRTSHDLKAPLSTILGLITIMKAQVERNKLDDLIENLQTTEDIAKRLERLILDLLDLTRAEHIEDAKEPFDIRKEMDTIAETLMPLHPKMQISTDVADDFRFSTSTIRLRQVLENLSSNSFKYLDLSKSEQIIKVRASHSPRGTVIEFSDNGRGIPEKYQGEVFKMFKTFHHDIQGSGLGLYLVRKHLEALHGTIDFKSSTEGTTFKIHLPAY